MKQTNGAGVYKYSYKWFIEKKHIFQEKKLGKSNRGECVIGIMERIQKILSSKYHNIQLLPSQNPSDFSNTPCFKRLYDYCAGLSNASSIAPLVFLFWDDDFEIFKFSQIQTSSRAGVTFRILNFPAKFQKSLDSIFIFSIAEPKSQDIMKDIVTLFNILFNGIQFEQQKLIPILAISLNDNPERYKYLKRCFWNSINRPCSHCSTRMKDLPFSKCPVNKDKHYLINFSDFLPHFYEYYLHRESLFHKAEELLKNTTKPAISTENMEQYVTIHQNFEKKVQFFKDNHGNKFVTDIPMPENVAKYLQQAAKLKQMPYFPKIMYDLDIPPFLFLLSYWKGLFPMYQSIPMEPFHTVFNIMKTTVHYLKGSEAIPVNNNRKIKKKILQIHLDKAQFSNFVTKINADPKEPKKFSFNIDDWHGDQYLQILKAPTIFQNFCNCITTPCEKEFTEKQFILLSLIKHSSPDIIQQHQLQQKMHNLQTQASESYLKFIKKKITSHQIDHLFQNSKYLGYFANFDGQYHEMKNKKLGKNGQRFFAGGDVSQQVVNFETSRENLKLMLPQSETKKGFQYDSEPWLQLLSKKWPKTNPSPPSAPEKPYYL